MSFPLSSPSLTQLTGRLRAAGCVFAEEEARLLLGAADSDAALDTMAAQRIDGAPLEHVVGWAEFCGGRVHVDRGVFVPRIRTEFLVHQAVQPLPGASGRRAVVVDLCCGSGAVGAAVATAHGAELHATDIDPAAVRCARRNVAGDGRVYKGDLDAPLPARLRSRVDVLLAVTPYVPTGHVGLLPREARIHESRTALDGGHDGLDVLRRVVALAPRWLAPGGRAMVEVGGHQAPLAADLFTASGLHASIAYSDDYDSTIVTGHRTIAR